MRAVGFAHHPLLLPTLRQHHNPEIFPGEGDM